MVDIISKERRSWNMSRIRSKNTKPEMIVRSMLHRMGFRFRLHDRNLPGNPDIVLPKHKTVIFVHGCFWHRHQRCKYTYTPKTRKEFWKKKFADNEKRDLQVINELQALYWQPVIIWECQTANQDELRKHLSELLKYLSSSGEGKE